MRILILKPSSLGDVVQAIPFLRMLKIHFPDAEVHWWLADGLTSLLEGDRDIARIIPFRRDFFRSIQGWEGCFRSIHRIRGFGFDLVFDLQALARSAVIAWLANGRRTIGLEDWREGAPAFYDKTVPRPSPHTHAVDWYLEVLRVNGVPMNWNFEWIPERCEISRRVRSEWFLRRKRWIVLHPGARWPTKRWPADYYREVIKGVTGRDNSLGFAVIGGAMDVELGDYICMAAPDACINLAGRTSIPEMIECIRAADLMLTNDTGPMHVASALSKPVVAMFGPTDPRRTGPYGQIGNALSGDEPCHPCFKRRCTHNEKLKCMKSIPPSLVTEVIFRRFSALE